MDSTVGSSQPQIWPTSMGNSIFHLQSGICGWEFKNIVFDMRLVESLFMKPTNTEGPTVFIFFKSACKWTCTVQTCIVQQSAVSLGILYFCLLLWPGPELVPYLPVCDLPPSWVTWCCWLWALEGPWWTVRRLFGATLLLIITLPSPSERWMERAHMCSFCGRSLCLPSLC